MHRPQSGSPHEKCRGTSNWLQQVVGVIDHHALQNATIVCSMPIYIDIRPWVPMPIPKLHGCLTS